MSEKSMVIVGAGIAGLSTGCYARMNGYKTTIFDMHNLPGGLCAAWKRKGYTFDISMHMLVGSKSGPFHQMWQELGVIRDRQFVYRDELIRIESKDKSLSICTDPRRLEEQMLALSPADHELTKEFLRLLCGRGLLGAVSLKPVELAGPPDSLKILTALLPHLGTFRRYGRLTIQEFAQRFQDPFLRNAIRFVIDSPGWPMLKYPMTGLAGFLNSATSNAGVPIGGSQAVVQKIAEYYRQLGGEIRLKCKVKDVIVENDRAVGVKLEDGTEQRADIVVWAGDGRTVIFDILGGRYLNDEIRRMYSEWIPVAPLVHVAMGIARDMSKEPPRLTYELENPINIAGEERRWLSVIHHSFDPNMAPPGKSAVEVWYPTRYEYWESLYQDRDRYQEEKKRIADITIAELDKRWPGFSSQVEVVDVPTPMTYVRYTGNWKGSPDGWYITIDNMRKRSLLRSLPGLSGFAMVGQWTGPFTGTVMAALSGRQFVQLQCKQDGRRFVTSVQ
jgi:phytoene dehydrogenase-like protein